MSKSRKRVWVEICFATIAVGLLIVGGMEWVRRSSKADERAAVELIERRGGLIGRSFDESNVIRLYIQRFTDAPDQVIFVDLSTLPIDIDLELANALSRIPTLEILSANGASLSDDGIKRVAQLKGLARLDISNTPVTDAAIEPLSHLDKLIVLNVTSTRMTAPGVEELRKKLPQCYIEY